MKVLASQKSHNAQQAGLLNAMVACGHEVILWGNQSAFDAFDENNPMIYVGPVDHNVKKCLDERPYVYIYDGPVSPAVDFMNYGGKFREEFKADLSIVADRNEEYSRYIPYLMDVKSKYKPRCYGQHWYGIGNMGLVEPQYFKDIYKSSKLVFTLDRQQEIDVLINDCLPIGPNELVGRAYVDSYVDYLIENNSIRQSYINKGKESLRNLTYFDQLKKILESWELTEEVQKCDIKKKEYHV